jgi:hypothetical protein
MTYTKPEINTLGDAASVIRHVGKAPQNQFDPAQPSAFNLIPAYDLDE